MSLKRFLFRGRMLMRVVEDKKRIRRIRRKRRIRRIRTKGMPKRRRRSRMERRTTTEDDHKKKKCTSKLSTTASCYMVSKPFNSVTHAGNFIKWTEKGDKTIKPNFLLGLNAFSLRVNATWHCRLITCDPFPLTTTTSYESDGMATTPWPAESWVFWGLAPWRSQEEENIVSFMIFLVFHNRLHALSLEPELRNIPGLSFSSIRFRSVSLAAKRAHTSIILTWCVLKIITYTSIYVRNLK